MLIRRILPLVLFLASAWPARAAIIRVWSAAGPAHSGASWPSAFATVGEALAAARPGDEVWVAAGTYPESITIPAGVSLYGGFAAFETARTQRSPLAHITVLAGQTDPARSDPTVQFERGATVLTVLDGFSIRTRRAATRIPGIRCLYASPLLRNNLILGCNDAGISLNYSNAVMENNDLRDNAGGGISIGSGSVTVRNNAIAANGMSGVAVSFGTAEIVNNTIVSNGGTAGGGIHVDANASARLVNNMIAFNASGVGVYVTPTSVTMRNNCLYGNGLDVDGIPEPFGTDGNNHQDPRLADVARGDLHIRPDSPCVDAGADTAAPDARDMDGQPRIQGARVDIGADESDGTAPPVRPPLIVRVRPDGSDAADGTTWATAKRTVQAAVDLASTAGGEVWVANGVYAGTLILRPYAYVYGGFIGNETQRSQREPGRYGSTLDGGGAIAVTAPTGQGVSRLDGFLLRNGSLAYGGGTLNVGSASPMFEDLTVLGNIVSGGDMVLRHSRVFGSVTGQAAEVSNCLVAGSAGDGLSIGSYNVPTHVSNNVVRGHGGAGIAVNGAADVVNNTVFDNVGAALRCSDGRALVANNVFAFNGTGISTRDIYGRPSSAIVAAWSNCLFGNLGGDWAGLPDQSDVNGNIAKDPRLAAARYGDFHIQPGSPCVDAGDSLSVLPGERDMDGQPRILGRAVDIGADESDGTAWNTGPALLHVRPDGDDADDGRTWATAKQSISLAVAEAPGGEIWVAAGTYTGAGLVLNDVRLYGGFTGTETERAQRNPRAHETVLDGGANGSVVSFAPGAPDTTVLDGFTIQNGSANHGGGVWFGGDSRGTLSDSVIRNNAAIRGGGIMVETNAAPTITRNIITGNQAAGGGGIEFWTNGYGVVKDNLITGNTANFGPGIFASAAYPGAPAPSMLNNTSLDIVEIWIPDAVLTNNIVPNNRPGSGEWSHNLFTGGGTAPADANGNVYTPVAGFTAGYRLALDSPAINAGDNAAVAEGDTDLDGRPRIVDGRVDIGAYEFVPSVPTVGDAAAALRLAAGITSATPALVDRLNVDRTGASKDVVDLFDAIALLRR